MRFVREPSPETLHLGRATPLGQMLGSRRSTVTVCAGILQGAGLITHRRGRAASVGSRRHSPRQAKRQRPEGW
jgi:hypothetical protein